MTRCLIVLAHPRAESLSAHLARRLQREVEVLGWELRVRDLCADGFDPRLTAEEMAGKAGPVQEQADLVWAEILVLVFPTWWFGFPAALKGWFDRVWVPGVAYDAVDGEMRPRLGLRDVLAVTTLGAPATWDRLVMRRPLRRVLARGIVGPCAPGARVLWRALYRAETVEPARLARFEARLRRDLRRVHSSSLRRS